MQRSGAAKKVIQIVLAMVVGVLIISLSAVLYPPLIVLGYALIGRSACCPPWQAFRAAQAALRLRDANESPDRGFQLSEVDREGFHRWQTPEGDYWIPGSGDKVLPVLLAQQRANIYGAGDQGVRRGDVVLDCGAHVGVFTRKALALGASKVVAIEPGPENLECLHRNLKEEISRGFVIVYPKGVWDQETTLAFQTFENSAADSFILKKDAPGSQILRVQVTTIDRLVSELGLPRVDFIKMDIKGATERALHGAQATLKTCSPTMAISTEESADNPMRITELARRLQPAYATECGYCAIEKGEVWPMVMFFHR